MRARAASTRRGSPPTHASRATRPTLTSPKQHHHRHHHQQVDQDGSGEIDFGEYCALIARHKAASAARQGAEADMVGAFVACGGNVRRHGGDRGAAGTGWGQRPNLLSSPTHVTVCVKSNHDDASSRSPTRPARCRPSACARRSSALASCSTSTASCARWGSFAFEGTERWHTQTPALIRRCPVCNKQGRPRQPQHSTHTHTHTHTRQTPTTQADRDYSGQLDFGEFSALLT